ncbi:MAG: 16S rRNA (guanine(527)-N(7))-methyltransferase RsmG [Anaerolinea sp.]|nr:16S rRNA (guanine(527)-N(7))-methyltransferase RsmG [Anaerolinea sp.]
MDEFARQVANLFQITLSPKQVRLFSTYEQLLLEWNRKINLTAIRDIPSIRVKHFLDSLSLVRSISGPPTSCIDVGTGAGFPGIPLKIVYPKMRLTLVESIGKKATFCQLVVDALSLSNVEVIASRAEDAGHLSAHREKYDLALARAVACMPTLAEYLLPLVRIGGWMIAQKGSSAHEETQTAAHAFKVLGGELESILSVELPGVSDERFLVVVKKIAATPGQYPRFAGQPVKKPL